MDKDFLKVVSVLVVVVIAASVVAVIAASRNQFAPIPWDPDTKDAKQNGWFGGGQFPDPEGDRIKRGELASRDVSYVSWISTGESLPFTISGRIARTPALEVHLIPRLIRYTFEIDNGDGLEEMRQDDFPEGLLEFDCFVDENLCPGIQREDVVNLPAREIVIDGTTFENSKGEETKIEDGAVLHVKLVAGWKHTFDAGYDFGWLAEDQVQLRSALPELEWNRDPANYKVGETARIIWSVPTLESGTGAAYFLTVTNENTKVPMKDKAGNPINRIPITALQGSLDVPITNGTFSNVAGDCQNRIRASMYSTLIRVDEDDASIDEPATIGGGTKPPEIRSITFDKPEYREGDEIKITWTVVPGDLPVLRVHVTVNIQGELREADLTGNATSYGLRAWRTGVVEVEVTALDGGCHPSATTEERVTIGNVIVTCEAFPDLPQCAREDLADLLLAALILMGLFIGFVVIFLVLQQIELVPGIVNLLIAILVTAGLAIWVVLAGYLDAILVSGVIL